MPGLLVVGDINVDLLARLENFTGLGGDNLFPNFEQHCGGVGANCALALAKWGATVRLLGCVGRDWFGEYALRFLRTGGVDVTFVQQTDRAMTGLMFIPITAGGQRTIFGSRGANTELVLAEKWNGCLQEIAGLHLVGYDFLCESVSAVGWRLIDEARKRGVWIALDVGMAPSQQIPDAIMSVAEKTDIMFVGQEEARSLTGRRDAGDALVALTQSGAREVIVKLGDKGCLIADRGVKCEVPTFPVSAIDTTGSGDAFAAAFLRARLWGWPMRDAALLANASGAAAAAILGAGEAMPGPPEVSRLLESHRLVEAWEPVRDRVLQRLRDAMNAASATGPTGGLHE